MDLFSHEASSSFKNFYEVEFPYRIKTSVNGRLHTVDPRGHRHKVEPFLLSLLLDLSRARMAFRIYIHECNFLLFLQ